MCWHPYRMTDSAQRICSLPRGALQWEAGSDPLVNALRATARPGEGWMDVETAAAFLGLSTVTLRRKIERCATKHPDGAIIAHVDGITARKLGRLCPPP